MDKQTTMPIVRTTLLGLAGLAAAGYLSAALMAGGGVWPHAVAEMGIDRGPGGLGCRVIGVPVCRVDPSSR